VQLQKRLPVRVHLMVASEHEAGPMGGRECSGYLFWLTREWLSLPEQMFFMHETPPDNFDVNVFAAALMSQRGFVNLLHPNAAVLRCFTPTALPSAVASSTIAPPTGGLRLIARTSYELPASLRHLLLRLGLPAPACVLTPCCANFRLRQATARLRTLDDLRVIDAYVRASSCLEVRNGSSESGANGDARLPAPKHRRAKALHCTQASRDDDGSPSGWPPTRCHAMEHAWHLVFGEPSLLSPLPPRTLRQFRPLHCCTEHAASRVGAEQRPRSGHPPSVPCSIPTCPSTTSLPCGGARMRGASQRLVSSPLRQRPAGSAGVAAGRESLPASPSRAAGLFLMHAVRALLANDPGCALQDSTRSPSCYGGTLLGSSWPLIDAWNATRAGSIMELLETLGGIPSVRTATQLLALQCTVQI
jgi:hypothetical protein